MCIHLRHKKRILRAVSNNTHIAAGAASAIILLACAQRPSVSQTPRPEAAQPVLVQDVSPESKSDTPSDGDAIPSVSEEVPTAPEEAPQVESPFKLIVSGMGSVVQHKDERYWYGEGELISLTGKNLRRSCGYLRGSLHAGKSLWWAARFSPMSVCPDSPILSRFDGTKFVPRVSMDVHDFSVSSWHGDSTIALVVPRRFGPPWGYSLLTLEGWRKPPRPKSTMGTGYGVKCHTKLQDPWQVLGFPKGEIVVLAASLCDERTEAERDAEVPAPETVGGFSESWTSPHKRSQIASIGLQDLIGSVAYNAKNIWALGTIDQGSVTLIKHFDGSKWTTWPTPALSEARGLVLSEENAGKYSGGASSVGLPTLWVLQQDVLRSTIESRDDIDLPVACKLPYQAWFSDNELWLNCESGLYTTDKSATPVVLDGSGTCEDMDPYPTPMPLGLWSKKRDGGCGKSHRSRPGIKKSRGLKLAF